MDKFGLVFQTLLAATDRRFPHYTKMDVESFAAVTRAQYVVAGYELRGERFTGDDGAGEEYIVVQGDYGWFCLVKDMDRNVTLTASMAYQLQNTKFAHLQSRGYELIKRCLLVGMSVHALVQLFDSIHRILTDRKVSANFSPAGTVSKYWANVVPGLEILEALQQERIDEYNR